MKAKFGEKRTVAITATLACLLAGPVAASDWKLGAGVSAKETYTDNVALSPKGSAKSDWISEITPTFTAEKNGARLKVNATYSYQNLIYANDATRNTNYHQLDAKANAELFKNEIFLDATASIRQAATNPQGSVGIDNSTATGNVTNVNSYSVSPYWLHRFGTFANLNARVTVSDVSYSGDTFDGSTNTSTTLALTNGSSFGRFSWGLNYSDQQLDYAARDDTSFTMTSATVGYLLTPRIRWSVTTGYEKADFPHTGPAPEGTFYSTGISWAISERSKLDFGIGDHYYGQSGYLAFKTKGNYSEWTVDYNEAVTTSNSQFSSSGYYLTANSAGQLTDIGTYDSNLLSNQVYLSKRFATAFGWKKGKHDFSLGANRSLQTTKITGDRTTNTQSVVTGNSGGLTPTIFANTDTVKQIGVNAGWKWQWTEHINTNVSASLNRYDYPGLSRQDTFSSLQLGLDRKFSPKLTGSVLLRRQTRDSNQNENDYSENALSGSVAYKF